MTASPPKLNARQELFAQGLLAGKTEDKAYSDAGYRPSMPHANRLARNGNVLDRLAELRKPAIEAVQITLESHLRDLKSLRNLAAKAKQYGAAVTAEVQRGKAAGVNIERRDVNVRQLVDLSGLSDADLHHLHGIARGLTDGFGEPETDREGIVPTELDRLH